MKIEAYLTDEAVLGELGGRLERQRLERNLTQRELAAEAGVERKAVARIESGEPVKLTSFVRVLRALDLLEGLERVVPEPVPSPIELLKLHGKERRRASGKRVPPARRAQGGQAFGRASGRVGESISERPAPAPWQWGDERTAVDS